MVLIPDFALAPQHSTNSSLNSAALKLKKKTYFCLKTHFSTKIFRFKILHFGRIFETWNSILVWQRMLIKHMTCPPVLVNLRVANCYIWQYVVSILPSNMKYCHLLFLPSRQNGRIFAVELISPVNFASEFLPSSSFSQWFLPVNFAIEIKKGNRHTSVGLLVHMDQIVRFNRETPDDILLTQGRFENFDHFRSTLFYPPIFFYFNSKI